MEPCRSRKPKKPLLPSFLVVSCLVVVVLLLLAVQPASAVPTSRSMQLRNLQRPPSLQEKTTASRNHFIKGRAMAARMVVEVNDYPGSGPNNRHDPPKGPGRG